MLKMLVYLIRRIIKIKYCYKRKNRRWMTLYVNLRFLYICMVKGIILLNMLLKAQMYF